MCIACVEYTKDKLTLNEFKNALRETSSNDPQHMDVVKTLIDQNANSPDELKKKMKELLK